MEKGLKEKRGWSIGLIVFLGTAAIGTGQIVSDSVSVSQPGKAALYSLIPGGGQVYNKAWVKAGLIIGLELMALNRFAVNAYEYRNFDQNSLLSKQRYLEKRNKYAWWVGFIYIYGLLDAVVDAHLAAFNSVMNEQMEPQESQSDRQDE